MKTKSHFAFFDEGSKKEIRRSILKAIAIPGYQVPFASREMPIARGWGTGGLQITLSIIGKNDVLKVIDQGADESVNAVSIKKLVQSTTGVELVERTQEASIIQSRHRIPEVPLTPEQILVLQVPEPEPLRRVEKSAYKTKILHSENDYSGAWLMLFEQIMKYGRTATGADHPVYVNNRYVMAPSPIPRYDNPKMHQSEALILLGAGREKKIYAIPPYTDVESLAFDDYPFAVETFTGKSCHLCGAEDVFLDELVDPATNETIYQCNDTSYCIERLNKKEEVEVETSHA
ncbi:alpha-D-ribose 1-methylphosphonate 5-phosphate C-P-lyase PhnJ [Oceanobacillus profundus]|uniref:Carbon-phosphorus lyase complex subunit PhnJ n=1 Tax=Oceanobacillus profundus TaxID=372463 RepID=A0A417YNQ5_9BACI|nr:alpha-D-ribose 1-methylphosphonate 5-phosphate C-P-lyase PhnJ [Oceanobacillus profundus]MCM3398594.1 alpha-D-ribose 1-methylphosphonate 5-phosphate C-P-lyase PhnJ [Oceanobacillus profundus]MDO6447714.1 alpha-D-ribose 1-methylphosphonate 5-phosphate C-P-lyase PhnJ [Oceanobacillus profundus]PAE29122.1 carbon-phosphorus lyase complex subunit PhnJ [Paenibacillus sp. 7884-2]RHW35203.1 carbon-phosphorus lyase complex subunit PhnJ [Oceanobacillus profundus]